MRIRHSSFATVALALVLSAILVQISPPSVHATPAVSVSCWPTIATANSQRWFRAVITWGTSESIERVYFGGASFSTSVAAPSGWTYAQGLSGDLLSLEGDPARPSDRDYHFGCNIEYPATRTMVITLGPFSNYYSEWLAGTIPTTSHSPSSPNYTFTVYWLSSGKPPTSGNPVEAKGTQITVPLAIRGGSPPPAEKGYIGDAIWTSGEMQAWYSGEAVGTDPLMIEDSVPGGPTDPDNGSGSDLYTFRIKYFTGDWGWPEITCQWRGKHWAGSSYHRVDFDYFAYRAIQSNGTDVDHFRKRVYRDNSWDDWMYWELDDHRYDHTGDAPVLYPGDDQPQAILIIDRVYNEPLFMDRESGSGPSGIVYKYLLRPTNYLQLLNNIFTLQYDPPGTDKWDTAITGRTGMPTSNAYVTMQPGGHRYEFLTTRDFDPPVKAIIDDYGAGRKIGPCAVVLRGRPGNSLEVIHLVNEYGNVYPEHIDTWYTDSASGGYGYPYDSQSDTQYPKVDPVLTAHPYFESRVLSDPERGFPTPWQELMYIGPNILGALDNQFNPLPSSLAPGTEPWQDVVGPTASGVGGGYAVGDYSPLRFTNQDTIWPNYVNIWGDLGTYDPDLSQPSDFRGGKWTTETNFVFRINYWQSENLAPEFVQVLIRKVDEDGAPLTSWIGYAMNKVYPTDSTYTDGCVYYHEANAVQLPGGGNAGDYQYYFRAGDGMHSAIYPNRPSDDFGQIGVAPGDNDYYWFRVNNRPTLSDRSLVPVSGPQRGDFVWEVTYADQDGEVLNADRMGDPPFKSILWIDLFGDVEGQAAVTGLPGGDQISYSVPGTLYADGSLVGNKIRMQTGAEAGNEFVITANTGSTITATDMSGSGIAIGDLFNITDWFAVTMNAVDPLDINYRDGVRYTFSTARAGVELDPGTHHYYFEFWDNWAYWINWQQYFMTSDADPIDQKVEGEMRRLPAQGYYEGPEVLEETAPILSGYYFAPPQPDIVTSVPDSTTLEYDRPGDLPGYAPDDVLAGKYLEILSGFAQFSVFEITASTATSITVASPLTNVQAGNTFRIYEGRDDGFLSWGYDTNPGTAADYDGTPATQFYLFVLYTDAENNPPSAIRVRVDDDAAQTYEMTKVYTEDNTYADGVLYRTSNPVYLAEGNHSFKAQAWDGAAWYNNGDATQFFGPYNHTATAADGPDVAPNAPPLLGFMVGNGLTIATVDPANPYIFTYDDSLATNLLDGDPVVAVYIAATPPIPGHNFATDSPGGGYMVAAHDPDTNTIQLSDQTLDLSAYVGASFTASAELVPRSGFSDRSYRYYVVYTDTDTYAGTTGNPAKFVNVFVDNVECVMEEYDPTDLDVSDGKVYYYDIPSLSASQSHSYYFIASDGLANVRFPDIADTPNYFSGPTVTVNNPPYAPPYPPADGWSPINGVSVDNQNPTLDWPDGSDPDPWDTTNNLTYIVQFSTTDDFATVDYEYDTTDYGGPGITQLDVPDPIPYGWWYWRVQTVDARNLASDWSVVQSFKVDHPPYAPDSGFAPTGTIGTLTPNLQWDPGTDPDADDPPSAMLYHVELDDDPAFASPMISPDLGGPGDPEYGVTGLAVTNFQVDTTLALVPNVAYHWHVRTVNGLQSEWSATQTFTIVIPVFSISGTVYDTDGTTPLEGVTVECYNSLNQKIRADQVTGTDGTYQFTDLPADTYRIAPLFPPFTFTPPDASVVVSSSDVSGQDFTLVAGAYSISGTITVTGGGSAQGFLVTAGIRSDTTNAAGQYMISGLADGTYTVTPSAPAGQYYDFTPADYTVTVSGASVTNRDFTADPKAFTISGTATHYQGALLANIAISAVQVGNPAATSSATTAADGTYTLTNVSAGDWEVTASDPTATYVLVPSSQTVTVPGPGGQNVSDVDFTGYSGERHTYDPAGLYFTGVPVQPIESYAPDVFATTQVWWWDPTQSPPYIGTGHPNRNVLLQVAAGKGFFVYYDNATTLNVAGTAVPTAGAYTVNLGTRWNMVANPFTNNLPMANIAPTVPGTVLPFAYVFRPSDQSYLLVTDRAGINVARSYIEPWEGAWMYAATGTTATIQMTAGTASVQGEMAPRQLDVGESGWVIPVVARVGSRRDVTGAVGVAEGIEPYSIPNPPSVPDSVDLYFIGDDGSQLAQSITPVTGEKLSWDFVVATDIADSDVEVVMPDLSQVPNDLSVTLSDLDGDQTVYMRTAPSYVFRSGAEGGLRHFRLEVGAQQSGGLVITSATAQSSGVGTVITYGVTQACRVSMEIMNISGRVIKTLMAEEAASEGTHSQAWNLRSNGGTVVPRGMYLVRIEAVADNGQRVEGLCPLTISR